jgi:RimJ/RimL family protein N-acetyltransferase
MTLAPGRARLPAITGLTGERVVLEPLDAEKHAADLFEGVRGHDELFRFLFDSPSASGGDYRDTLTAKMGKPDPYFLAILDRASGKAIGHASYLRIEPVHRVIEVGNILFTPRLQRTAHATEAMYLMARHAFEDLGYRRYEWKCNARNAPSRSAALRLGFTFEGIFRRHMIVKGESRDTAWYAMIDEEWPGRKAAFEAWLNPSNFDESGRQKRSLASFRTV